jgi:hypothetical protein
MELIKALCDKHEIDYEWMSQEVLRKYHERKVDSIEITDKDTESVIRAAIQQIK